MTISRLRAIDILGVTSVEEAFNHLDCSLEDIVQMCDGQMFDADELDILDTNVGVVKHLYDRLELLIGTEDEGNTEDMGEALQVSA